ESQLSLQSANCKLQNLDAVCPQPEAAHTADEAGHGSHLAARIRVHGQASRDHVGLAGNAVGSAPKECCEAAERRVMAYLVIRIGNGGEIGSGDGLHQPATNVRRSGALTHRSTEARY